MSLLIAEVKRRSQINTVKLFLEVYFVIKEYRYIQNDLMVLAYYCLFGISPATNKLIKAEYARQKKSKKTIDHALHHAVYRLSKKLPVLIRDPYTLQLDLCPDIKRSFEKRDKLGVVLKFDYEEAEPSEV